MYSCPWCWTSSVCQPWTSFMPGHDLGALQHSPFHSHSSLVSSSGTRRCACVMLSTVRGSQRHARVAGVLRPKRLPVPNPLLRFFCSRCALHANIKSAKMGHCTARWLDGICILVSRPRTSPRSSAQLGLPIAHYNGPSSPSLALHARQCRALHRFVSPRIGALSDKYGRKRILLLTMIGNILSALV